MADQGFRRLSVVDPGIGPAIFRELSSLDFGIHGSATSPPCIRY